MDSDTGVSITFAQSSIFLIRVDGFSANASTGAMSRHVSRRGDFIRHSNMFVRQRLR
jgi:hypothetical protein